MEQELFYSGYCRVLDQSRMVEVLIQDAQLAEVDCCFPDCIHTPNCIIAQQIRSALEQ